jgi:hypothetical protein
LKHRRLKDQKAIEKVIVESNKNNDATNKAAPDYDGRTQTQDAPTGESRPLTSGEDSSE